MGLGFLDFLDPATNVANFTTSIIDNAITRKREDTALQRKAEDARKAGLSPTSAILGGQGAQSQPLQTTPMDATLGRGMKQNQLQSEANDLERLKIDNEMTIQLDNLSAREAELKERIDELENSKAQSEADRQLLARYNKELIRVQDNLNRITAERDKEMARATKYQEQIEKYKRIKNEILGRGDMYTWSTSDSSSSSGSGSVSAGAMGVKGEVSGSGSSSTSKGRSSQDYKDNPNPLTVFKNNIDDVLTIFNDLDLDVFDIIGKIGNDTNGGIVAQKGDKYYVIKVTNGVVQKLTFKNRISLENAGFLNDTIGVKINKKK